MNRVLAIDAGNTKTVALVARTDGTVIGSGRSGCGDIYGAASAQDAIQAISAAADKAMRQANAGMNDICAAVLSAAGADWPGDFAFLRAAMSERGLGRSLLVVNDAIGALCAGSSDGTGVVVAVGTGVATGARAADGRTWHSGFWQRTHGAQEMAERALDLVYRAELGLEPPTALTAAALAHFDAADVEELLFGLTSRQAANRRPVAGFAPMLLSAAVDGDGAARRLVVEHGRALGEYALVAARKVGIDSHAYDLVLTGGVLRHPSTLLAEAIVQRVHARSPAVRPLRSQLEPAAGALLLALDVADVDVDDPVRTRVTESMPHPSFFAT